MDKLIIVPFLIIIFLLSLIGISYFYPYFVNISISISNTKFYYDLVCFTLTVNVERPFNCYYIMNITGIKILNSYYNISNSFCIYNQKVIKNISFNIPNSIANLIANHSFVKMTLTLNVCVISSLNTRTSHVYYITANFTNTYLEYLKQAI